VRAETVLYSVKIITKPVIWQDTENPFVDALTCPICDKASVLLDPAVVLTDGPQQKHVNLSKVEGKMLTMRGTCKDCKAAFLLRILLHSGGTYTWHDIGVTAEVWNALLSSGSKDQLPCMCKKCQLKGVVMPAADESTASPSLKEAIAKLKAVKEDVIDPEIVDATVVPVIHQQGYALTMGQHRAIAKAMKANWDALAKDTGLSVQDTQLHFVNVIEAYVRIKFATFQPSDADDPSLPPKFPTIVPKSLFAGFKQSGEDHLCQYLVTSFSLVDQVLGRPDLPASVIYHHMCRMCKLTDCSFHPSKRDES
jgi:hypothetical protein